MKDLKIWIQQSNINCTFSGAVLIIEDFGKLLFIKDKDGIIIRKEWTLVLDDEEYDFLDDDKEIKYVVFKFGNRYYYCDSNKRKKNEYNEQAIIPEFKDFRNIGKFTSDFQDINFCHLGIHTGYELLNGSGGADSWINKAKFYDYKSLGICERNTLAGSLAFQLQCDKSGIKSIIGETISVVYDYDESKEFQNVYEVKIFIKNEIGWRNLLRISKAINVDYDEFIPLEKLLTFTDGLIFVFFRESYLYNAVNKKEKFISDLEKWQSKIDFEDLYFQIDLNEFLDDTLDISNLEKIKTYFDKLSKLIKPIYIEDSYYVEKIDASVKTILNKIDRQTSPSSNEQYFKSIDEIIEKNLKLFNSEKSFNLFFKSLENTFELSEKCSYKIDVGNHKLPKYNIKNKIDFYHEKINEGFYKKVYKKFDGDDDKMKIYLDRIDEENDVIIGAGFVDYFLILWDVVNWAKTEKILVGPGRGSAGGSLVAYLLGIIEIDPIEYDLLFERFLNKTRVMPEIFYDIEFEDGKKITLLEGDKLPLKNGEFIDIDIDLDFSSIDIDIDLILKK